MFDKGRFRWEPEPVTDLPNRFFAHYPEVSQYQVPSEQNERTWVNVMDAIEGQLITKGRIAEMEVKQEWILSDPARDILHLTVVNRYRNEKPANAFVSDFLS